MTRFRRDTRRFRRRALNSLVLAIEIFNRPYGSGRTEAVLILLQHAFEMFLKAAIYEKRGTIFDSNENISFKFDKCLGIAKSDLNVIDEDQAQTISILDGLRDCAAHNLIDLTEQALYIHTQAAVTLFEHLLNIVFNEHLADYLPTRILPISTNPPKDMITFLDSEFTQIQELLRPGLKRRSEARGRLRHLMIMDSALLGDSRQPTEPEINRLMHKVRRGDNWQSIFSGVAGVRLETRGQGPTVSIRFTRQSDAAPVRVVSSDMPGYEDATLIREVDLLDRYSLNLSTLAQHLGLTEPKTLALARYLNLKNDCNCYKEFHMGKSSVYKRYSPEALNRLRETIQKVDMKQIWQQYGTHAGASRNRN
jgi:hypothetical protein